VFPVIVRSLRTLQICAVPIMTIELPQRVGTWMNGGFIA